LYPNEDFAIDLGSDIKDVNVNTDRMNVKLYLLDPTNPESKTEIPAAINYDSDKKMFFAFDNKD